MSETAHDSAETQNAVDLLQIANSQINAYIHIVDNENVYTKILSGALSAIDRATDFLQPEQSTHPDVGLDDAGHPVCECGSNDSWVELGRTDYSELFDEWSWTNFDTDPDSQIAEVVVCRQCKRTYKSETFPKPD